MTAEEMNRAMGFILQNQAQTSVHLEELARFQVRERELLMQMAAQGERTTSLLELQSRRLDRLEEQDRFSRTRHEQLMTELRSGLDRIFDKLLG